MYIVDLDSVTKIEIVVAMDGTETVIFESDPLPLDEEGMAIIEEDRKPAAVPQLGEQDAIGEADQLDADDYNMLMYDDAKGRRNRVYGAAQCPECGQTFVNTARLERHLSVHQVCSRFTSSRCARTLETRLLQVFGQFLCQLCGKTYKYEYNLFYHWRKTCHDLAEYMNQEDRKQIEVNQLREASRASENLL